MNTSTPYRTAPQAFNPPRSINQDFEQFDPTAIVEHMTVSRFILRIPYDWHMDEVNRFGKQVGISADALQLSYQTAIDRKLGMVRIFPVPLLQRIYELMAAQFGWPRIVDALPAGGDDERKMNEASLRANDRVTSHLKVVFGAAQDLEVQQSLAILLRHLSDQSRRLRANLGLEAKV